MKRIFVNEQWCLGCHLCEYNCAFANTNSENKSHVGDMAKALKNKEIFPKIQVEEKDDVCFAVSCRHCYDPLCVKGCIAGALSIKDGVINIDQEKCVGCYTCILSCPYGAIMPAENHSVAQKCELCTKNSCGEPACVAGCPNNAIVFEER
jgi:carbon-monoxide dehydrogenase iron sulfur subunit